MRLKTFVVLVAVLVLGWPGVAHAKGPTEATIEGDSLEAPIVVAGDEGGPGDFWKLVDQSGFFETTFRQSPDPTLDEAPTTNLGASFLVTWEVPYEGGKVFTIRMTLYPYAEGGPVAYSEPGQRVFDTVNNGGWVRASHLLPATLEGLGVTDPNATPARTAAPAPPTDDDTRNWWPVSIVVAAAVAGLGGLFLARRRVRMSPA